MVLDNLPVTVYDLENEVRVCVCAGVGCERSGEGGHGVVGMGLRVAWGLGCWHAWDGGGGGGGGGCGTGDQSSSET